MRIAIYTAIFGDYDELKPQPRFPNTDYICFSDTPKPNHGMWNVVGVKPPEGEHPRITAKRIKTCPHQFLGEYDLTLWIDGSIVINTSHFLQLALGALSKWGISCMRHPVGNCIYSEALGCVHMEKYQGLPILEQVESYRQAGYPTENGLAACGIIGRDMRRQEVAVIGEQWLAENLRWTYQDQLSFPYVLWKNGYWYDQMPFHYLDRSVFFLVDHRSVF
jgi:hypothetical protein